MAYFSSALVLPSSRRATMSCLICWVPSKYVEYFGVAGPLLQQLVLAVADAAGQLDAPQRDVGADPTGLRLGHRGLQRVRLAVVGHPRRLQRQQVRRLLVGLQLQEPAPPRRTASARGGRSRSPRRLLGEPRLGQLQRRSRASDGHRRDQRPRAVEGRHGAGGKPCLVSTSGSPSRFSFGTRQSSKRNAAVSTSGCRSLCRAAPSSCPACPWAPRTT